MAKIASSSPNRYVSGAERASVGNGKLTIGGVALHGPFSSAQGLGLGITLAIHEDR